MAAAVAGRSVVYFTFGDTRLRDDIAEMYSHFIKHETNIGTGVKQNCSLYIIVATC